MQEKDVDEVINMNLRSPFGSLDMYMNIPGFNLRSPCTTGHMTPPINTTF